MMRQRCRGLEVLVVITLSLLMVAVAVPVGATEQEARVVQHATSDIDAFKGNQGIRTDPATVTDVGYVHTSQVDTGAAGGDFVAIGTANGNGVTDTGCADDYDAYWTVFTDGKIGGAYFCVDEQLDAYTTGANPSFKIEYAFCIPDNNYRWMLWFGGGLKDCRYQLSSTGIAVAAGLETTGTSFTDRNIDVKFTGLYSSRVNNANWEAFGQGTSIHAPNYSYQYVNTTAFDVLPSTLGLRRP